MSGPIFVDISSNNPHPINFQALKDAGVDGVMVKATQGTHYTNPDFGADYEAAKKLGLRVGAYMFPEWMTHDLAGDVQHFIDHYGEVDLDFPAALDLEDYWDQGGHQRRLGVDRTWADVAPLVHASLDQLAAHYKNAWGYWNRDTNKNLDGLGGSWNHGVWLAQGSAGPMSRAAAMQFAPVRIPGVNGLVDWNVVLAG